MKQTITIEVPEGKTAVVSGDRITFADARRYTLKDFRTDKIAVEFTDDEQGKKDKRTFLKACEREGMRWCMGVRAADFTPPSRCITFNFRNCAVLEHSGHESYERNGYIIVPFAQFDLPVEKRTGYERAGEWDTYYTQEGDGTVSELHGRIDSGEYDCANHTTDKALAEANARADTLWRRIRRRAAELGGIPSPEDWKNNGIIKYGFGYDYHTMCFHKKDNEVYRVCPQYFLSKEGRDQCMKEFESELLWYYTEYKAQLY